MKRFMGIMVLIVLQLGVAIGWLAYGPGGAEEGKEDWVRKLELPAEDRRMQEDLAMWYNLNLAASGEGKALEGYGQILYLEDGLMCCIEFPQGQKLLPVWHGASARKGEGLTHLSRSALPVGGKGNHVIFAGGEETLEGMDIPEKGNEFCLRTVGGTLVYRIFDVKTTGRDPSLPEGEADRDLCSIWIRTNSGWVIIRAERAEK